MVIPESGLLFLGPPCSTYTNFLPILTAKKSLKVGRYLMRL